MYLDHKYAPWKFDREFTSILNHIRNVTLVDDLRVFTLWELAKSVRNLEGSVAEVGVYKGGTLYVLSQLFREKAVYGFDTFTGMPDEIKAVDFHRAGDFKDTTLSGVQRFIGAHRTNVSLVQGIFPASAQSIDGEIFSFAHIDCDIYQSVLDCCAFFYPRMPSGGVMLFDDYGFESCKGAMKAVDEFFSYKVEGVVYLVTGQALVIKR